jgi:hypothetical protein
MGRASAQFYNRTGEFPADFGPSKAQGFLVQDARRLVRPPEPGTLLCRLLLDCAQEPSMGESPTGRGSSSSRSTSTSAGA